MTVDDYLNGYDVLGGKSLRADQGLDTTEQSPDQTLESDLVETQYIVEVDNRLGSLCSTDGTPTPVSFIDDDSVASYFFSRDDVYVRDNLDTERSNQQPIQGPRGTYLNFKIRASTNLKSGTYLFDLLGSTF